MELFRITTLHVLLILSPSCLCDMILPSFHWNLRNTIFQGNEPGKEKKLCRDPAHIYVNYASEFYFICPHKIMDVAASTSRLKKYSLFENIHMVNEDGFNKCQIDRPESLLLKCDQSLKVNALKFELIMFHKMNWNGWSFKPNNTYYFINTSNGTKAGLDKTSGGRCQTHNMKLKVTVCHPEQKCSQCKGMCCEKPPTTKPPTTTATTKTTTPTIRNERRTTRNVKVLKSESVLVPPTTAHGTLSEKTSTERKRPIKTRAYKSQADVITTHYSRSTSIDSNSVEKVPKDKKMNCTRTALSLMSKDNRADKGDPSDFNGFYFTMGAVVGVVISCLVAFAWHVRKKKLSNESPGESLAPADVENEKQPRQPIKLVPDRCKWETNVECQRLASCDSYDSGCSESIPTKV